VGDVTGLENKEQKGKMNFIAPQVIGPRDKERLYQLAIGKVRKYCRGCLSAASSSAWSWDR